MQGSMRRRGDSWQLRVYLGRDPLTGEKRWTSKTVKGGKREAQRALAAMVAAADGNEVASASGTVGELLDRWFENASADFSPKTALETAGFINRYLRPGLGVFPVARLRTEHIDKLYRELRKRGGHNGKPLAPGTVKRTHVILHRALEQAVRWGWIRTNPAHNAQVPPYTAPGDPPTRTKRPRAPLRAGRGLRRGLRDFHRPGGYDGRSPKRAARPALVRYRLQGRTDHLCAGDRVRHRGLSREGHQDPRCPSRGPRP